MTWFTMVPGFGPDSLQVRLANAESDQELMFDFKGSAADGVIVNAFVGLGPTKYSKVDCSIE